MKKSDQVKVNSNLAVVIVLYTKCDGTDEQKSHGREEGIDVCHAQVNDIDHNCRHICMSYM